MFTKEYIHRVAADYNLAQRLSRYLVDVFPGLETASSVKKAIKKDSILINGRIGNTGDYIRPCDVISYTKKIDLDTPDLDIDVEIVFEDEHLLILNKPFGMVSVSSRHRHSIQGYLHNSEFRNLDSDLVFPQLIHRLDRDTGGLIIAAKDLTTRRALGDMLEQGEVQKYYTALVEGRVEECPFKIASKVDDKAALTYILNTQPTNTEDRTTMLSIKLATGRKHQIRRHLHSICHPIVGDNIYNKTGLNFGRGLFLMARRVEFLHPITQIIVSAEIDLHAKFNKYVRKLSVL